MATYFLGIDWADASFQVCVLDEAGQQVLNKQVSHQVEDLAEFGRWLLEQHQAGIRLCATIEKPEGRVVDFLLDHQVEVYPVNPKALDRARDRYRASRSKSDPFDAFVLADFLRTDRGSLSVLAPNSPQAAELKVTCLLQAGPPDARHTSPAAMGGPPGPPGGGAPLYHARQRQAGGGPGRAVTGDGEGRCRLSGRDCTFFRLDA